MRKSPQCYWIKKQNEPICFTPQRAPNVQNFTFENEWSLTLDSKGPCYYPVLIWLYPLIIKYIFCFKVIKR